MFILRCNSHLLSLSVSCASVVFFCLVKISRSFPRFLVHLLFTLEELNPAVVFYSLFQVSAVHFGVQNSANLFLFGASAVHFGELRAILFFPTFQRHVPTCLHSKNSRSIKLPTERRILLLNHTGNYMCYGGKYT